MKKKISIIVVFILACSIFFTACAGTDDTPEGDQDSSVDKVETLTVSVGPDPDTIDPALNSSIDGATLVIHAFEGLMRLDKDGVPVYGQAESHEVSEDGKTYTFTLRDGLKWSDGEPLTASDFVYSWKRAVNPETAADYEYMFDVVEGYGEEDAELNVTAPDDRTIVVQLNAATPYFLELTAFPTFSPVREDIVEDKGDAWAVEVESYIGNGAYKMVEWIPGSHILYEKNEHYWDYDKLGTKEIKFVLMGDENAILNAFTQEEILFADSIPSEEIDAWKEKPEFNLKGELGTNFVSFNVQKSPLDDSLVREAMTLAIDRDWICVNIGKSGEQPAGAFVATGLSDADPTKKFREVGGDYFNPNKEANEENLEKAKELLAQAGYPDGEGLANIEYMYIESATSQAIAEALQDMWKKIGVNVTLVPQEWGTFLNSCKNGEYFMAGNGWTSDYNDPISMLDIWLTDGGNNIAQWSNAEYDALISKVKASSDPEERFKLMHEAEDIMFEESMLCPLYYYVDLFLINERVDGFWSSPLGYKYFMYATVSK